jgi:hypothetical protein
LSNNTSIIRFVREALPLLSSFLYSEQVLLEPLSLDVSDEPSDEFEHFARSLRLRHAIACGLKLKPILEMVERGVSHASKVVRSESKGPIFGRLDLQLYLHRRGTNLSWPRAFPILAMEDSPNTPENQLIVDTLRQLARRLNEAGIAEPTAERTYSLNLLRWSRERLHAEPWAHVQSSRGAERLKRESEHRIRKRQTGNEPAYRRFLDWYTQWRIDASRFDSDVTDSLVNLLLAFPPAQFFEDRVFEVWCLHQVIESFRRCGAIALSEFRPLSQRGRHPVCEMHYDGYRFAVWFQRPLPSEFSRWHYLHSGRTLAGIPDITVIGDGCKRLFIDAKRREVTTDTRPEETYKVLGYLENFRELFDAHPFWCALCFLSNTDLFTEVTSDRGDRIFLVGAHPVDVNVCALGGRMDALVSEWLSHVAGNDQDISVH